MDIENLTNLKDKVFELLEINDVNQLTSKITEIVNANDYRIYEEFVSIVEDLSKDWLQKIYQYYLADRKNKMQDYTPPSIAKLIAQISMDEQAKVIDMCAGSGALTIQRWNLNHKTKFVCYELDGNVIPILLFNLAVRNIDATVHQEDVLLNEISKTYKVIPQERFSKVVKIDDND